VDDLGHLVIPSLLLMVGKETAQYIFWLGTLPLELFFVGIALVVLFTGKGIRLGICLYVAYFLHWVFLHLTTLPPPDHSVCHFPVPVLRPPPRGAASIAPSRSCRARPRWRTAYLSSRSLSRYRAAATRGTSPFGSNVAAP